MKANVILACTIMPVCILGGTVGVRIDSTDLGTAAASTLEGPQGVKAEEARTSCPTTPADCGNGPCVVDFKVSASMPNGEAVLTDFKNALGRPNTTVRLASNVDLNFSGLPASFFPIGFGRCVTLTSVKFFELELDAALADPLPAATTTPALPGDRPAPVVHGLAGTFTPTGGPGRTPSTPGPALRFGAVHPVEEGQNPPRHFFQIRCDSDSEDASDGVRISGVRIFGPSFGHQTTDENGIRIIDCIDIEISNSEIAGWGGAAIRVESPGLRLVSPDMVKIVGNFLHHNQHPSSDGHAAGYGVNVDSHANALIAENLFDFNRHAIAADGDSFGYEARRNLILKGGGYHGSLVNRWTHLFDVHGNGHSFFPTLWCDIKDTLCLWCDDCEHASTYDSGDAGHDFVFSANAFQYRNDHAIKIRGRPRRGARIEHNVFPHDGFEDDWGDDAVALQTHENVTLGPGNVIEVDTYGQYGICDFDGDGVDDLFLATGQTWWYSSFGEFQWSYLSARQERLEDLRLGYFDDDRRCDVLTESGGEWLVSSGGFGPPTSLGFGAPLAEVHFGRFDPNERDHRTGGITRRTTHAFRRMRDGEWQVTPLSRREWKHAQRSELPMSRLKFGDFTGDAVTDVLAVVGGRWVISAGAHGSWQPLNSQLDDSVSGLFIANMDPDDNIDDVLRLERQSRIVFDNFQKVEETTLTWWRSKNGVEPWREYKRFEFRFPVSPRWLISPRYGFAGRFGVAPGGGVMVIDHERFGRFYSHNETRPEWKSRFAY